MTVFIVFDRYCENILEMYSKKHLQNHPKRIFHLQSFVSKKKKKTSTRKYYSYMK